MKQLICLFLSLCFLVCLCACSEKKSEEEVSETEQQSTIQDLFPESDKVPIESIEGIRKETGEADDEDSPKPLPEGVTLPSFLPGQVPDPEPVEPSTELADS